MMKVKREAVAEVEDELRKRLERGLDRDSEGVRLAEEFLREFDAEYRRRIEEEEARKAR